MLARDAPDLLRDPVIRLVDKTFPLWAALSPAAAFGLGIALGTFGRRAFETDDESRNLAWLAPLALGEAWRNNHHAFPTSAAHGCVPGNSIPPPGSSPASSR